MTAQPARSWPAGWSSTRWATDRAEVAPRV